MTTCPICQSEDFGFGQLTSAGYVFVSQGPFSKVPVHCSVCLSCGVVAHYVDRAGLEAIRAKAVGPRKPPRDRDEDGK